MVFHRENYGTHVFHKLKNYENWPNLKTKIRGLLAYILIPIYIYIYIVAIRYTDYATHIYIYMGSVVNDYTTHIQGVPEGMCQTSGGCSLC